MQHINRLLIYAVLNGDLPGGLVAKIALDHMLSSCNECRREYELAQAALRIRPTPSSVVTSLLAKHVQNERRLSAAAERDFKALLRLPEAERRGRIYRARHRFRGAFLIQLLLEKSHDVITTSPYEALHWAQLGQLVAVLAPTDSTDLPLYVLVLAQIGNASRAAGQFNEADESFRTARKTIVNHGIEDPLLLARVDDLESSLRRDQRRLGQSEELLARALFLYGLGNAPLTDKARILVKLGQLYQLQGMLIEAAEVTETALRFIAEAKGQDHKLYFAAMYNLAVFYADMGRADEASKILTVIEGTQEALYLVRITGLRGKIAAVLGDFNAAEKALLETRDSFIASGEAYAYDAAIVSLDLALLYARQRRTAELHSTVASMVSIFEANELHREALAAVLLTQDSLKTAASEGLLRDLLSYMLHAQQCPPLRYQPKRETARKE